MVHQTTPNVWDSSQYWLKAKSYVTRAQEHGSDSPDYALWYAFALEHLARAVLCSIHPVLNADPQHVKSLFYGVGVIRTEQPKSLPIHAVYNRLGLLFEKFTGAYESFCGEMANRRNAELHSSELPFEGLKTVSWLARYYKVAEVLCHEIDCTLEDLFGEDETEGARKLIDASKSSSLGKVKEKLARHQAKFDQMSPERQSLLQWLGIPSERLPSETVTDCPACGSRGRLGGTWFREGKPSYGDTELVIEVTYLSNSFKCSVCDLELQGEEEVLLAKMPPTFTETQSTSLHEIFEPEFENEYMNM